MPNLKRGQVAQDGSVAKVLRTLNDEKDQEIHALEVKHRQERSQLVDKCSEETAELTRTIKDKIARKKMELEVLEAELQALEKQSLQQKQSKLEELEKVHEEQLCTLVRRRLHTAQSKLPNFSQCQDCTNLVVLSEHQTLQCHMGDGCAMSEAGFKVGGLCSDCLDFQTCAACQKLVCRFEERQQCEDCDFWECDQCADSPVGAGSGGFCPGGGARMWTECAGKENSCNKLICKKCAVWKCAYGCTFCKVCSPKIWYCDCGGCAICNLDGEKCCNGVG